MLNIIFIMLDSNVAFYGDVVFDKGFRIGTYFAQWFANFFLQNLDHYIKEELHIKCYLRYVDDMVLLSANKKQLHKDFIKIRDFVGIYGLEIKSNWQVFKFDYTNKNNKTTGRAIDFMGFKFYRNRTTLRKSIVFNSVRKARKMAKKENVTHFDASQILSYLGWFKSTKTYLFFRREILSRININTCKKLISRKAKEKNDEIKLAKI